MIGIFLVLRLVASLEDAASNDGVIETKIDGINYVPHIYNDHIGIQNIIVKPEKLYMRSTIDESSMVRWEIPNPTNNWSFTIDINELNLESRESASIFLFYTKEKPVVGSFKGGPTKFHGFTVGMEFTGKAVDLVYANNEGIDYKNIDEYVSLTDSLNPQRFLDINNLKFKVICTEKNFKVEIYGDDKIIYDNFRHFTKEQKQYYASGGYFSIFADYKHTSSSKAFELKGAQLYHREETADYSTTKSNMIKISPELKLKSEIKHSNVDIQELIFKSNAVISYIKAMIGDLPETSITKAEKELIKEVEALSDKISKAKGTTPAKSNRSGLDGKINQIDVKLKKLSKMLSDVEYLTESNDENGYRKYHQIFEYFMIFSGMVAASMMLFREVKNYYENRKPKILHN